MKKYQVSLTQLELKTLCNALELCTGQVFDDEDNDIMPALYEKIAKQFRKSNRERK